MPLHKLLTPVFFIFAIAYPAIYATAQDSDQTNITVSGTIPAVRLLSVEGGAINMSFTAPAEAGNPAASCVNNSNWLNYTSIVNQSKKNKITVAYAANTLPAGTTLYLNVTACNASAKGLLGSGSSKTLSDQYQDLVTNIGSAYTGTGIGNGRQLTYTWSINPNTVGELYARNATITIYYTMIEI